MPRVKSLPSLTRAVDDVREFMSIGQPEQLSDELRAPVAVSGDARVLLVGMASVLHNRSASLKHALVENPAESCDVVAARLMVEELGETLDALLAGNVVAYADGLVDLLYVTIGAGLRCGIPLDKVWAEVQRANMSKFPTCATCGGRGYFSDDGEDLPADAMECRACEGRGHIVLRDAAGKVVKPEGWTPPNVAGVLRDELDESLRDAQGRLVGA